MRSLTPPYQTGLESTKLEIVIVDNGSPQPVEASRASSSLSHLWWRRSPDFVIHPYERMVADPFGHFRLMLWLMGFPLDDARLRDALNSVHPSPELRLNAGVVGRSADLIDTANRLRLEQIVLDHPEASSSKYCCGNCRGPQGSRRRRCAPTTARRCARAKSAMCTSSRAACAGACRRPGSRRAFPSACAFPSWSMPPYSKRSPKASHSVRSGPRGGRESRQVNSVDRPRHPSRKQPRIRQSDDILGPRPTVAPGENRGREHCRGPTAQAAAPGRTGSGRAKSAQPSRGAEQAAAPPGPALPRRGPPQLLGGRRRFRLYPPWPVRPLPAFPLYG